MSVFILSEHESLTARVQEIFSFAGHPCPIANILSIDDGIHRLGRENEIEVVLFILSPDVERALTLLPALVRVAARRIIAVGPAGDAKLVLRSLRAGAADYVDTSDLEVDLLDAIERLNSAENAPREPGKLITVLSPNGGGGSSTLAVSIAASLAAEHKRVGLIDLKLESGDLAALLDLKPTFTLSDLCQNSARLDHVMFERSLVTHDCGIHLLAPPQELAEVRHVHPETVSLAVTLARSSFPYVVADLDHSFHEEQLVVLRQSDFVLLVFRLDFISLRNVRRTLEHLEHLGMSREKVRLIANRYGQSQEVPYGKAEEALGMKIVHAVPDDPKAVNRASNHGVPVVLSAPTSKVSKTIKQIAQSVNGQKK
jgi:pilus assembly protein CpaE